MSQATLDAIAPATMRLLLAEGLGPVTLRKLREHFSHDDQRIAQATIEQLMEVSGVGEQTAGALHRAIRAADPAAEHAALERHGVRIVLHGQPAYPALLAAIPDPPPALWVRGEILPQDRLAVALVGSRKCTAYGREQAARFATLLAQAGLTIVSGGALGIDGEAHRAALRVGGRTIVVAGCGLSRAYPPQHADLFDQIVRSGQGAIVSEFPMDTAPHAGNFPRRNRIISGLSLGVLVIEAAHGSGALITARHAAEDHQREVMTLPGRVDSPASAGCHKIIQEGWAALVVNHADVLRQLDASSQLVRGALEQAGQPEARSAATLFDGNLTPAQQSIVEALGGGEALLVEQVAALTGLPLSQVMAEITLLQIRGRVTRDWQGRVRLKAT